MVPIHSNKDLKFILDTNVVSEPVKRSASLLVLDKLNAEDGAFAITSVVWHELLYGVFRMPEGLRREAIEDFLKRFVVGRTMILSYDALAAEWFAAERARLAILGISIPDADGMIAAVAATRDLTLVTRNMAHFEHFEGLAIENWFE